MVRNPAHAWFPAREFIDGLVASGTTSALVFGSHFAPAMDELFTAARGKGAHVNGKALGLRRAPSLGDTVGVVDFKRLPRQMAVRLVTGTPFHSQRNFGCSAIEWSWLAAGRFHFYLHGGQQMWDMTAGSLILAEAGGVAGNFAGTPLGEFRHLEKQSVVAALDASVEQQWRTWLAGRT